MKRNQEEHRIQCGIIKWAREPANIRTWPALALLHAIPNGGARDSSTGAMLKREGVLKGVWDLFLPACIGFMNSGEIDVPGLYIEVKSKHGRLTREQRIFRDRVRIQGYATQVVISTQEGIDTIIEYLEGRWVE